MYVVKLFKRKIGITGLRSSGKTAFLTSLINHLKYHHPDSLFRIGENQAKILDFKPLPSKKGQRQFEYEMFRNRLVNESQWPTKTTDSATYRCSFRRSDWKSVLNFFGPMDVELEFFDFPGDRLADIEMLDAKNYEEWSALMIGRFQHEHDYHQDTADFLHALERDEMREEQLVRAYKMTLAQLIRKSAKALISPSTFIVDLDGDEIQRNFQVEDAAQKRYVGLSRAEQFTPLPPLLANANPVFKTLHRLFEHRYEAYRKQVVLPILRYLKSCHRLIVLVDIATLLNAGIGMYNDNQKILELSCRLLDPGVSGAGKLIRAGAKLLAGAPIVPGGLATWKPSGITRIAFVASQADRVHPDDREHLLGLLKQMIHRQAQAIHGLHVQYFTCSAIVSSRVIEESSTNGAHRSLIGFPTRDESGRELPPPPLDASRSRHLKKIKRVSRIPKEWPEHWAEGEYVFPKLYPFISARKDCPPEQIGLDRIFQFMMEEDLTE